MDPKYLKKQLLQLNILWQKMPIISLVRMIFFFFFCWISMPMNLKKIRSSNVNVNHLFNMLLAIQKWKDSFFEKKSNRFRFRVMEHASPVSICTLLSYWRVCHLSLKHGSLLLCGMLYENFKFKLL